MKAIQKELGEGEDGVDEFEALKQKIDESKMPQEAREKTEQELQKAEDDVANVCGSDRCPWLH
ncbi:hypothetical protein QW180_15500 [Vibrio sinaloensis]|nr:hypothetical protein [Vibrio sinaloensis]